VFFLAFLPLFVAPESSSPMVDLCLLSAVFMAMTLVVFIGYGLSAHSVRTSIVNSPTVTTWMQRSFAALFAALGVKLAMTEQ
jgi:threonine/homoserine/homoserine lactone efflux protein